MSAKREKQRRAQLRREYEYDLRAWKNSEPPKILFWWWHKWKKSRPVFNKRAEPTYFKWRTYAETYTGTKWY